MRAAALVLLAALHTTDAVTTRPLWCDRLKAAVDESRATLATRYGRARLNATSIFSHNQEALAARIADALNNNQPLRFGLTGGSHAVGTDEGGWATNLTRWVDDVLGRARGAGPTNVSAPPGPVPPQKAWERCVRKDPPPWLSSPPSFRATAARWDDDGAQWHNQSWPLDRICENRLEPRRVCPVFWGSGKHATLVNGAKGGLTTAEATWAIGRALDRCVDVLLWDHGVNDMAHVRGSARDAQKTFLWFLARAQAEFPRLAAVVVVFWQDDLLGLKGACAGEDVDGWQARVPDGYRGVLVEAAQRWPGTAVVTMSLPAFCRKTPERRACHPAAFMDWLTSHPTSLQNAAFADLVIWQLLPAFDAMHASRCESVDHFQAPAPPRASHHFHAPRLAASFFGWSPLASSPPRLEDLAVLCAPGRSLRGPETRKGKAACNLWDGFPLTPFNFTVFATDMRLPATPRWARLDFSELLWGPALDGDGCAGWGMHGCRDPKRCDEEYRYSSTSTPKCPSGGGTTGQRCRRAPRGVERYPAWPAFSELPIRAADVGLRVSSKYAGCFLCSTLHPPGRTRYYAAGVAGNATPAPQDQMKSCLVIPRVEAAHVVFWCPAEECYPVVRGGRGKVGLGHGALKPSIMVFCGHHSEWPARSAAFGGALRWPSTSSNRSSSGRSPSRAASP